MFKKKLSLILCITMIAMFCLFTATPVYAQSVVVLTSVTSQILQDIINDANGASIIVLPAGTFNLNATVEITRAVNITGKGASQTTLRDSNIDTFIKILADNVIISNIRFQSQSGDQDVAIKISDAKDYVIRNCTFYNTDYRGIEIKGVSAFGVISHCSFQDMDGESAIAVYGDTNFSDGSTNWNNHPRYNVDYGSANWVFVEDCSFTGWRHAITSNTGSKYVFRYNQVNNPSDSYIDAHGQESGSGRGSRAYEIYNNHCTGSGEFLGIHIRGGDGLIYNNIIENISSWGHAIYIQNPSIPSGATYPLQDQIMDLHAWGNVKGTGSNPDPATIEVKEEYQDYLQEGRDYYNTTYNYTPYPYPHPMAGKDAYSQIEAESYNSMSGVQVEACSDTGGGSNIGFIHNNDYIMFSNVDFGSGATQLQVRAASAESGGKIEIRLDNINGPLAGICNISNTGGWQNWVTQTYSIGGAFGNHNVYLKFTGGSGYLFNVNWIKFTQTTPSSPSAYSQIEAENCNVMSGTVLEECTDTGGGQHLAYIENNDYIAFHHLNFGNGATGFQARIASNQYGGNIEIRLDSLDGPVVGTCSIPITGDWQKWVTRNCSISGVSGVHTVFLKFTGESNYLFNLNWIKFIQNYTVNPYSQVEAESYDTMSGIELGECTDSGGGYTACFINNGDYIMYQNVNFQSGTTGFQARVASAGSGGNIEIRLDSLDGTLVGTCAVPSTGGWQTWQTSTCNVSGVSSGNHTLYLKFTGGSNYLFNLNWIKFTR